MTKCIRFDPSRRSLNAMQRQRGATLIIGLIMLVLITLMMLGAFTMSSSNLKSVGNMQVRQEAVAAANQAIEELISAPFTNALGPQVFVVNVDNNSDATTGYTVNVATPTCTRAVLSVDASPSDVELGSAMSSGAFWNTEWDIDATVEDAASGATVRVRQGVRVLLDQTQRAAACP